MRRLGAFAALAMMTACSEGPTACPVQVELVDPQAFRLVAADRDPFELSDAGVTDAGTSSTSTSTFVRGRCTDDDVQIELLGDEPSFSIITRFCARGTAEAPLLADVASGEPLTFRLWHYSIQDLGPGEAFLEVALDGAVLWTARVPLPSPGKLVLETFAAPLSARAGAQVRWHVANHGSNSWNFLSLSALRQGVCPDTGAD